MSDTETTRRRWLATVAVAGVAGCLGGDTDGVDDAEEPDDEGEDDDGTDDAPSGNGEPTTTVTEAWRAEPAGGTSPMAVGAEQVVITGEQEAISLDAQTGAEQWRTPIGETERSIVRPGPAIADGTVYALSQEGVTALAAGSVDEQWTAGFAGRRPLVLAGGRVYYSTGDRVYGFDADSGEQAFSASGGTGTPSPAVADGTVYMGTRDGVAALDADSATEEWRYETGGIGVAARPAVANGTVYAVGFLGGVYALDAESGEEQWTGDLGNAEIRSGEVRVAGGRVYVSADAGPLVAFDAASGERLWSVRTNNTAVPAIDGDTVYVGRVRATDESRVGELLALAAASGEVRWAHAVGTGTGQTSPRKPVVANGRIYTATADAAVALSVDQ